MENIQNNDGNIVTYHVCLLSCWLLLHPHGDACDHMAHADRLHVYDYCPAVQGMTRQKHSTWRQRFGELCRSLSVKYLEGGNSLTEHLPNQKVRATDGLRSTTV